MGNGNGNASPASLGHWIKVVALGRRPAWTLVRILILVGVCVVLFRHVILLRRIESVSMVPTFQEGSVHAINRLAYRAGRQPQRGDVVAVRTSGETVLYVKRIIGLPGESIAIRNGTVLVNGQPLEEPYVRRPRRAWNLPERNLGPDHFFVVGDNRSMAQEQHEFGAVDRQRVVGKVFW